MMTKYTYLTDETLLNDTRNAAKMEKAATLQLLEYLLEVERRKAFAIAGHSSLFEYAVKELKYSESQASERVRAMRLLKSTPEARPLLASGDLTLTSATLIQRFVQKEKCHGTPISPEAKVGLVAKCAGQSKREVEKVLFESASVPARIALQESVRDLTPTWTELKFSVGSATQEKLRRIQELLGVQTLERILDQALETLIEKEERRRGMRCALPAAQPKQSEANPDSRFIPVSLRREIFARSGGQCEFKSEGGYRCTSRFRLQIDHRLPFALGGKTELRNLRHLCPGHNARARIEAGLKY